MSEETPPTYTTSIFNQSNFGTTDGEIDTAYLNSNYLRYPIAQTGLETIANLATTTQTATTLTATTLTATNDATINGLTVGKGGGSLVNNTALGVSALSSNVNPGFFHVAIGYEALKLNSFATSNTAVGYAALSKTTTGGFNTAFGVNTLLNNVTSLNNTAIGAEALNLTTGGSNTALGYQAGRAQTSGTNNTYIGALAQANANTYTNSTALGYNATITASNQVVLGTNTETVVIPNQINFNYTSNPTLAVGSIGYNYQFTFSGGAISSGGTKTIASFTNTPVGIYLLTVGPFTFFSLTVSSRTDITFTTLTNITSLSNNNNLEYGGNSIGKLGVCFTLQLKITNSSNQLTFNASNVAGGSIDTTAGASSLMRIA